MARAPKMRPVQLWHGSYRVRKPIPKALQAAIGRGQYLTRSLGTADPRAADKRAPAVLAEFQAILDRAERIGRGDVQGGCIMAWLPKADLLKAQGDELEWLRFARTETPT